MEKELKEYGLSDNEITVYLALLKTGTSTANRIANLTGMKRSTTYDVLRLLVGKGIISTHIKSETHRFECSPPKKLVELLEEKKELIEQIIPRLETLQKSIPKQSSIKFFEGRKGIWNILEDIFSTGQDFIFYGSRKEALNALKHYPENFSKKRALKGMRVRSILAEEDRKDPTMHSAEIQKYTTIKYLKSFDKIEANTFIYGEKVAFMSSGEELLGIVIDSPAVYKQQKKLFEILWKIAEK
ncbi:hypothetical protein COV18_01295 [Candidatus Woesearchaeota archaeon CG10_big_fil_rev_8_21_14_0_10_37_12]|nr:MAG: hypothetical protein COV18_01295 [Candidatus Woesearchaeota archaeon CG10_big_fil_rev_8_21_14_0_10_37_12]